MTKFEDAKINNQELEKVSGGCPLTPDPIPQLPPTVGPRPVLPSLVFPFIS